MLIDGQMQCCVYSIHMIWDLIEESDFDKHFQNEDLSITTLLLDEKIITQLKNQNPKLLHYIDSHKQQLIQELIEYTITMPKHSDGHNRCHKLPYISSEILALNSQLVYMQFFKQDQLPYSNDFWMQLLTFLETTAAENQVLMGYFQKVFNNLYSGNKTQTTQVVAHNLDKFICLLHNGSVGDMISKSLILLSTAQGEVLAERQKVLLAVMQQFVKGNDDVKAICSNILVEVINKFQTFSSGDTLLENILNHQQLHQIYAFSHSNSINDFLIGLLKKSQQRIVNEHDVSVRVLTVPQLHLQNLGKHLRKEVEMMDELLTSNDYILNQNKVLVRKSNKKIYSILALVSLAIEQSITDFMSAKIINNLWKILIIFPYNNILQVYILKIFTSLLKNASSQGKTLFLDHYEAYLLQLARSNLKMFRPVIFSLWKEAKSHKAVTADDDILKQFAQLVQKELQPLLKYDYAKSSIQMSAYEPKKTTLRVDEEDNPSQATPAEIQAEEPSQAKQAFPSFRVETFEDFIPHAESPPKLQEVDFFSAWQSDKSESKSQQQGPKESLFDDFTLHF